MNYKIAEVYSKKFCLWINGLEKRIWDTPGGTPAPPRLETEDLDGFVVAWTLLFCNYSAKFTTYESNVPKSEKFQLFFTPGVVKICQIWDKDIVVKEYMVPLLNALVSISELFSKFLVGLSRDLHL